MDYEFVRASKVCPLCNGKKDFGLLVCWNCYQSHDIRNNVGLYLIDILKNTEEDLRVASGL